jgi:hypothetical protein
VPFLANKPDRDRPTTDQTRPQQQRAARTFRIEISANRHTGKTGANVKQYRPYRKRRRRPTILRYVMAEKNALIEDRHAPGDEGDAIARGDDNPAVIQITQNRTKTGQ